ncbi:hypothetical protein Acid345_3797 [Candidatus Koribacter versatilis Ellin345]|uniref:Right handed beta helix domain-containing protein n=1 Tax=Koribacter versatilis (strain Ellin345) TaxID=204669 RepID=Q1IK03_KORVE|nr:right-handed parallel beta-helix repeat-containing protein [Candidatus Koribacter versatilis]ABF42797.1 hypothetical protein Acid345_3797 [Candidatus Koribacter versatilis Ellin345]
MAKNVLIFLQVTVLGFASAAFAANASSVVRLKPDQDFASIIKNAPAGSQFEFAAGDYRMASITPKTGDSFRGNGQAVLNGAKLVTFRQDGKLWSISEQLGRSRNGSCEPSRPACLILNDLFIDDKLQTLVLDRSQLTVGTWYYDQASLKAYISVDPTGHKVELGSAPLAFAGSATDVTIDGFTVEKYANSPQTGAVGGYNGSAHSWIIRHVETRWNHGVGIAVGSNSIIQSSNSHHNGQLGMAAHGENIQILDNTISNNNYAGFKIVWEAGGTKFSGSDHLLVRGNVVEANYGNGLWTDIDNIHVVYEKNRVLNNTGAGIVHEISYDAVIRNNFVSGNRVGIIIILSSNVQAYGNVVEVPPNGTDAIRVANGNRGEGKFGPYVAHDIRVYDNIITFLGSSGRSGLSGPLDTARNVVFENNQYHLLGGGNAHWIWGSPNPVPLSEVQRVGSDKGAKVSREPAKMIDPTRSPE